MENPFKIPLKFIETHGQLFVKGFGQYPNKLELNGSNVSSSLKSITLFTDLRVVEIRIEDLRMGKRTLWVPIESVFQMEPLDAKKA